MGLVVMTPTWDGGHETPGSRAHESVGTRLRPFARWLVLMSALLLCGCSAGSTPEGNGTPMWVVEITHPAGDFAECHELPGVSESVMSADMPASRATLTMAPGSSREEALAVLACVEERQVAPSEAVLVDRQP